MRAQDVRKRLIPIVLVAVVVGVGYLWWSQNLSPAATATVLGGTGTIEAEQVVVSPQAAGRIIEAKAQEGTAVNAGDVLYKLDPAIMTLQVAQADIGIKAAQANYDNVRNDSGSTSSEKSAAKAQLDQAKVAKQMAQAQLGFLTVKSPLDGTVVSVVGNAGENATPGSALAVVSDLSNLTITIYVPEDQIGKVSIGQKGKLTTDSSGKAYNAEVEFIASSPEFAPSSLETKDQRVKLVYQVRLKLTDADSGLKPGMPADVELQ
jgi:HlyD family secretion protein